MKILITGLCTLHWGRLEYGNIGNYYIIEPLFEYVLKTFPDARIYTTFQMTSDFVYYDRINILPMDLYYSWRKNEKELAQREYTEVSRDRNYASPYTKLVRDMNLLINVSGDMWGDNAEHVGKDRFWVDLYKMRIAQLFGVKTVLLAGTPGPFHSSYLQFAKEVFQNFDLVTSREYTSTKNLKKWGFSMDNVMNYPCPSFLYNPVVKKKEYPIFDTISDIKRDSPIMGFTIGGFNMPVGPYDMWPREDQQYTNFVRIIEHVINEYSVNVMLISHTNGFDLPPDFKLKNGRDYPILKQLYNIIIKRGNIDHSKLHIHNEPFIPAVTKRIIGAFDMMITGRVHASVAAVSQTVPTVFVEYDKNVIESTKMYGFSNLAGLNDYVCTPDDYDKFVEVTDNCWANRIVIKEKIKRNISVIIKDAEHSFHEIKSIVENEGY